MKGLIVLALVLVLLFAVTAPAFAASYTHQHGGAVHTHKYTPKWKVHVYNAVWYDCYGHKHYYKIYEYVR